MNLIGGESQHLLTKRGDTLKLDFLYNVTNSNAPLNLTNCTARLHLRFLRTDALIINATTENDLLTIEPELGLIHLKVSASELIDAPIGKYSFDLELTFPDGDVLSSETGVLEIIKDITTTV